MPWGAQSTSPMWHPLSLWVTSGGQWPFVRCLLCAVTSHELAPSPQPSGEGRGTLSLQEETEIGVEGKISCKSTACQWQRQVLRQAVVCTKALALPGHCTCSSGHALGPGHPRGRAAQHGQVGRREQRSGRGPPPSRSSPPCRLGESLHVTPHQSPSSAACSGAKCLTLCQLLGWV